MFRKYAVIIGAVLVVLILALAGCAGTNLTSPGTNSTSPVDRVLEAFGDPSYWDFYKVMPNTKGEIIFAEGLVRDVLSTVYANEEYVFASGWDGGYSYFKWEDIKNLIGKITNIRVKVEGEDYIPGNIQWAEDESGNIYALYWDKILDAFTGDIIFDSSKREDGFAPTHGFYGCSPYKRFVVADGAFWVGSSEAITENRPRNPKKNSKYGLFRIDKNGTNSENLLPGYDVWRIYEDSSGRIWISALNGVYYYDTSESTLVKVFGDDRDGKTPEQIYSEELSGNYLFCEDIVEYNDDIYFLMKNFFARGAQQKNKKYYVYVYNEEEKNIIPYQNYPNELPGQFQYADQARFLVYNNNMYVVSGYGRVFDIENGQFLDSHSWQKGKILGTWISTCSVDGKEVIATVSEFGSIPGIRIFGLSDEPFNISQANTSEALLSNYTENIFYDEKTDKTYFSHGTSGGYTVLENGKFIPVYFDDLVLGLFRYNDELYLVSNDVYKCTNESENTFEHFAPFRTNLEKIRLHNNYLWSIETGGARDDSYLYCLNLDNRELRTNKPNPPYWLIQNSGYIQIPEISKYQIFDLIGVDEDRVFIAVGSAKYNYKKFPYIFEYEYSTNSVKRIDIPNENEHRIRAFAKAEDGTIYAIGAQTLYKYDSSSGEWQTILTLNRLDLQDARAIIIHNWMFVVSEWWGVYVIHLESGKYKFYKGQDLPLVDIKTIGVGKENGKPVIWFGSANGLGKFKFGELVGFGR